MTMAPIDQSGSPPVAFRNMVNNQEIPASIQHLPVELLVHIFRLCLPWDLVSNKPTSTEAPLLLCRICSQWREIALGAPRLWSSLSFEVSSAQVIDAKPYGEAANHWFQRAGTTPLSLRIDTTDPPLLYADNDDTISHANELVQLVLVPYIHRIRELELVFKYFKDLQDLIPQDHAWEVQTSVSSDYEWLEFLWIEFDMGSASFPITIFQSAPRLRHVKLYNVIPGDSLDIFLPWAQLTVLEIELITESILMTLLAQCTNLINGTFYLWKFDGHDVQEYPIVDVVLQNLTHLSITFDGEVSPDFFRGIQLPRLSRFYTTQHQLVLHDPGWNSPSHLYLQLSGVERLTISDCLLTPLITEMLHYTGSVTRLKVLFGNDQGALFRALTIKDDSQHLLPNLQVFSILYSSRLRPLKFALTPFIEMLVSRIGRPSFPPLRRVKISFPKLPNNVQLSVESAVKLHLPNDAPELIFITNEYGGRGFDNAPISLARVFAAAPA